MNCQREVIEDRRKMYTPTGGSCMWRAVTKRSLRIHDAQHRPDLQNRPSTHSQFKSRHILPQKKNNGKENRPTNDETVVLYEYACVYSQNFIISI